MGRYPFVALLNEYLACRQAKWTALTHKERTRKLKYLYRAFKELHDQGKIKTLNPKKFDRTDILAYETWLNQCTTKEGKTLDPATKAKYRSLVKDFLLFHDNPVYKNLIEKGQDIDTQLPPKTIKTIDKNQFTTLLERAKNDRKTWSDHVKYLMVAITWYSIIRPKELRLANISDINTNEWLFTVSNPKGMNKYGRKRTLPIVEPLRPIIKEYIEIRKQRLTDQGVNEAEPLIPAIHIKDGKRIATYYSGNRMRMMARQLSKKTGISFQTKMLRASGAQNLKNENMDIETVSALLGHTNIRTTQQFYATLIDQQMIEKVNRHYSEKQARAAVNSVMIDTKTDMTGYA
jgi:integrase